MDMAKGVEGIGSMGGKYVIRVKNRDGSWTPWLNLGGGFKGEDVQVELKEPFVNKPDAAWNALLDYVLDKCDGESMTLLRLWREGGFDEIRQSWPDAPEQIFPKM